VYVGLIVYLNKWAIKFVCKIVVQNLAHLEAQFWNGSINKYHALKIKKMKIKISTSPDMSGATSPCHVIIYLPRWMPRHQYKPRHLATSAATSPAMLAG
jgi:hypothetical protein